MSRIGSLLFALLLLADGAAASPLSAADAAFRVSAPSLTASEGGILVSGFVCREDNLYAPVPVRVSIAWRGDEGRILQQGDAAIVGGGLDGRGRHCGRYALKAEMLPANGTRVCVAAYAADGRKLHMREACTQD